MQLSPVNSLSIRQCTVYPLDALVVLVCRGDCISRTMRSVWIEIKDQFLKIIYRRHSKQLLVQKKKNTHDSECHKCEEDGQSDPGLPDWADHDWEGIHSLREDQHKCIKYQRQERFVNPERIEATKQCCQEVNRMNSIHYFSVELRQWIVY